MTQGYKPFGSKKYLFLCVFVQYSAAAVCDWALHALLQWQSNWGHNSLNSSQIHVCLECSCSLVHRTWSVTYNFWHYVIKNFWHYQQNQHISRSAMCIDQSLSASKTLNLPVLPHHQNSWPDWCLKWSKNTSDVLSRDSVLKNYIN